jgi:hypothetical protein
MKHPLDIAIGGEITCDLRGALLVFRSFHNRDDLVFDTLTVCISLVRPNLKFTGDGGIGHYIPDLSAATIPPLGKPERLIGRFAEMEIA